MFVGVKPAEEVTEDVGVGSRLLGACGRLPTGAKGHTAVRHAVVAAFTGVTSGVDAVGNPPQDAGAGRMGLDTRASRGSVTCALAGDAACWLADAPLEQLAIDMAAGPG